MKKLILTGLATEQPFYPKSGNIAAEAKYFLIFNDGELRVETNEKGAETCVAKLMEAAQEQEGEPLTQLYEAPVQSNQRSNPISSNQGIVMGKVDDTYSTDEDGVDQV